MSLSWVKVLTLKENYQILNKKEAIEDYKVVCAQKNTKKSKTIGGKNIKPQFFNHGVSRSNFGYQPLKLQQLH